ncbi:MAG TPA: DUF5693 family protein [Bacillota bacterium]|nr:DUF5693 family protein [Bacillota bacterium]
MIRKILWIFVVISLVAALPLVRDRYRAETSTRAVEAVVDYADLLKVSSKVYNSFTEKEIVDLLKNNGITTIAFYEQTLKDLATRGIVSAYSTSDDMIRRGGNLPFDQTLVTLNDKLTKEEQDYYGQMLKNTFRNTLTTTIWNGKQAFIISNPMTNVYDSIFLGPDFNLINQMQHKYRLHSIVRINSDHPWDEEFFNWQFARMKELGINKVVFEGKNVLGFPDHMEEVAEWMKQDHISFGLVDFFDQNGYKKLGRLNDFHTFRVLSVASAKVTTDPPTTTADVFSLGIRERDVRMIYVHLPLTNSDQVSSRDILDKTVSILQMTEEDINRAGYVFKETRPFALPNAKEHGWENALLILGMLSLASLCLEKFYRPLRYLPIPLGLLFYLAGEFLHQEVLAFEMLALMGAIIAPTYSTMLVMDWVSRVDKGGRGKLLWTILTFLFASVASLYGAVVVVSLLNDMLFVQYLEQFRGVKALYFVPILLVILYWVRTRLQGQNFWDYPVKILNHPIYVKHIVITAIAVVALGYFLSRSGNEATTLPFELKFRQILNDVLGVRPRTKEIFLGHPFFLLASYLMIKYRKGIWLFIIGVIGQMSLVSTFTHIHTPLLISIERTINGIIIGLIVGVVLIFIWEWLIAFFKKHRGANNNG